MFGPKLGYTSGFAGFAGSEKVAVLNNNIVLLYSIVGYHSV